MSVRDPEELEVVRLLAGALAALQAGRPPGPAQGDALVAHLLGLPAVVAEARRQEAVRQLEQLLAEGLSKRAAAALVAARMDVHPDTVRLRWGGGAEAARMPPPDL